METTQQVSREGRNRGRNASVAALSSPATWDHNITIAAVNTETGEVLWMGPKISALESERIGETGFEEVGIALTCLPPDEPPEGYRWDEKGFFWIAPRNQDVKSPVPDA